MKTDRYKDWESKFFEGEELTPEEELFLKNESENPYFSFLKEEKQEKLDISFEDFLKKTEEPKIIPIPIKKTSYKMYWMAASLILLMGVSAFWMFNQPQKIEATIAKNPIVPKKEKIEKVVPVDEMIEQTSTPKPVLANQETQKVDKTANDTVVKELVRKEFERLMAQQETESNKEQKQIQVPTESISDYNPNYVIINGKPIYDEGEAIAVTENAFNYFASNITQTINHAESAQNQVDFYRILNY
ncbi:hypothetical protein NG800_006665 [Epilithonimonas ginsengisoli]|uniref:Uncharacterized protein n=1 Tax=Epilithonimonas ginsengisoli TaxID=1245592 RepID=A0ABU4JFX6_9FLAO|nr:MULTISPECIES: hypothetical protein [Chryseobacterium group]MBV6879214.1 hypothetical protein [Epilithonimonas sp. FP105]MDW8548585.1 hypothetical protein [Epilithonimonas ginsengisoli]OAH75460.1 hypothetical protein AXA65_03770 [Chryseobacterium sp. FP211-J200]